MKIKQLDIKNYGPLVNKKYQFTDGFNLLFGENEQGKSLTFDALIKLLFGKFSKKFTLINRVEEDPASFGGFVTISTTQDDKEREHRLQGKTTLSDLTGLTASECNNIFLIRNSDLSIGQDLQDQDQFYLSITDRLTGLQTEEIASMKNKLLNYGQLTETHRFLNTQESDKLAEKIEKAQQLLISESKLNKILSSNGVKQWLQLEENEQKFKQKIEDIKTKLAQLALAKKVEDYLEQKNHLGSYQEIENKLAPLKETTQEKLDRLRSATQEEKSLKIQQAELKKEVDEKLKKADQIEKELSKISQEVTKNAPIKEEIERSIQPESFRLVEQLASIQATHYKPWKQLLFLSGGLLFTSLLVLIFQTHPVIISLTIIFFLTTIFLSFHNFLLINKQQKFDTNFNQLKLKLKKYDIKINNPEEIDAKTSELKQIYNELLTKQSVLTVEKKAIRDDISEERDKKLSKINSQLIQEQETISRILLECSVNSMDDLIKKLQEKKDLENRKQKISILLETSFGRPPYGITPIDHYSRKIAEQKTLEKETVPIKFSEQQVNELETQQSQVLVELENIQQRLNNLQELLKDFQREISSILPSNDNQLIIDNINDLIHAKKELESFLLSHTNKQKNVIKLISILEELESEEKEKVSQFFGKDSIISSLFKDITQGNYTQVYYNQTSHQIMVEKKDGTNLTAQQLSSGTYDQLYLTIRLGLGKALLKDKTGFFIMDDPFLKSDQKRLENQLELLLKMAKQGWQIIYFSAKNEVSDFFVEKKINKVIISQNSA